MQHLSHSNVTSERPSELCQSSLPKIKMAALCEKLKSFASNGEISVLTIIFRQLSLVYHIQIKKMFETSPLSHFLLKACISKIQNTDKTHDIEA